jgi:hypothetical protein
VHKLRDVIGLVRAQGNTALAFSSIFIDELERLGLLGATGCLTDAAADGQAMAVLDQVCPT